MSLYRIIIADDHTLLRDALAELIRGMGDFDVVAAVGDAPSMVAAVAEHRPDVVLMDIEMPGNEDPARTVRALQAASTDTKIMVLTMHDDPRLLQALLPLGIRGYLHKTATHRSLTAALRDACSQDGLTVSLPPRSRPGPEPEPEPEREVLSRRELEVIALVATGLSNRRTATQLGLTEGTVKRHMRNIFSKLGATSRVDAANKAVAAGLIPAPTTPPPAAQSRQSPL
ncbi:response regulator transcription factor [Streptomyces sp. SP18CS02]|uniref:response regulator transcription factor n=1 Tax=Streptomyces sp. SP18CS02 TaxID=3002531 RepID=UPI002E799CA0|nr:response regulator transcription factor [Streptomyces sp. SP18CS02]MEE1756658.1 response regulator transcription factor [Streptomyces sp. SP18CS02]